MKVLVVGGSGFIGSHIIDRLLDEGVQVRSLSRRPDRFRPPLQGVEYLFGSFAERMVAAEALYGVDAVIHSASATFPVTGDASPQADVTDNLVATLNLVETMLAQGTKRLLFVSSGGTVYGVPDQVPTPETHPLRPRGSYGIVKVAIEHYLEHYRHTRGLSPIVVRASNPYGPRQGHAGVQGVVSTFLRRCLSDETIEIWGDGSVVRDYIHVSEVADMCVRALLSPHEATLNCGSGEGHSLNEVLEVISQVTGRRPSVRYKVARPSDVPRSVLDVAQAERLLGWRCRTPLGQGIASTWEWISSTA